MALTWPLFGLVAALCAGMLASMLALIGRMDVLAGELRGEMRALRTDLTAELRDLRADVHSHDH